MKDAIMIIILLCLVWFMIVYIQEPKKAPKKLNHTYIVCSHDPTVSNSAGFGECR